MQVSKFSDILAMEDGQQIMAFRGRIKAVFKPNAGTNDKGAWQVQNLFVAESMSDGAAELRVAIWNDDEIPKSARGKEIILTAVKNQKGQWSGLKCEHYEGKPRIKVSGAEIVIGGQDTAPAAEQPDTPLPEAPASTPPRTTPSAPPPARKTESSPDDVRGFCVGAAKHVGKLGNAMKICIARAIEIGHWHQSYTGRPYPADGIQALATTLFIQGTRDGVFDKLPNDRDIAEILPSLSAARGAGTE